MPTKTLPTVGISDKAFRYRPAASTDIRKTFARVKRELAREQEQRELQASTVVHLVTAIKNGK
ncbi:hypothetical protein [Verminephrobacter aporrectodeae]|uniref:hypothetical protein n=1 Tax=Verminephrobacter aporrectodeae TaxID=1110389 RepID=UPI002237C377|nr:hypothetical protein [Verminephrobacter aporrectodeae]